MLARTLQISLLTGALAACGARTPLSANADAGARGGDSGAPGVPDGSAVADLSCGGGVQPGAPWPTVRRCPTLSAAAPIVGPRTPEVAWTVVASTPVVPLIAADGTLYVPTAADGLLALAPDGSTRWTAPQVAVEMPDLFAIGGDGTIYAVHGEQGTTDLTRLSALRPDGTLAWSSRFGTCQSGGVGVALGQDRSIYTVVHDGAGCTSNGYVARVVAFAPDGSTTWSHAFATSEFPTSEGLPVGIDGNVYVAMGSPSPGGQLDSVVAIRPDGTQAWRTTTRNGGDIAVAPDGTLYVQDGTSVTALRADGSVRWQRVLQPRPASGCDASKFAAVDRDGTLYALDRRGTLHAIRPDGTIPWQLTWSKNVLCGPPWRGAPIVSGDGTIYFGIGVPAAGSRTPTSPDRFGTVAVSRAGDVHWAAEDIGNPVALGADGTLYTDGPHGFSAIAP